jgi:hypothetical protein
MTEISIPFNKQKNLIRFLFCIAFVLLGIDFIINPYLFIRSEDPFMIKLIGYICITLFGAAGWIFGQKLFNRKPAIILDEEGILDNSAGMNIGKILWEDIVNIRKQLIAGENFLMIDVKNPMEYIDKEMNPVKKQILGINHSLYQTPIHISTNRLKIGFEALHQLITERHSEQYMELRKREDIN